MNAYKKTVGLLAAILTFVFTSANALTPEQTALVEKAFENVPTAELAAKAANIVAQTPAADREQMAILVTRTVIKQAPAAAVPVVAAIVVVAPEVAPAVAGEAASLLKEHAEAIAVAATKAAPPYADRIAQAVVEVVPDSAAKIVASVRTAARSAITPVNTGTITIVPGTIRGLTPTEPPSWPAAEPVVGADPKRYSSPE